MLDAAAPDLAERAALRKLDAPLPAAALGARSPALPVRPELHDLLPGGLRRGSTVSVTGSLSLLLALLAEASVAGAWCVLVDLPVGSMTRLGAEAARDFGIELDRLPVVPAAGESWTNVVGALLDAFDVVAARAPARLADGDLRRLAARARARDSVLLPFLGSADAAGGRWPMADLRLTAQPGAWSGIGVGHGRLARRRMQVSVEGRGHAARTREVTVWLPGSSGGVEPYDVAPVVELSEVRRSAG
ncbi:MAG TPA: hypothetical protein VG650_17910 [Mycobacteriales bacterium]|nr:hypothetical protein [Mycobacteriales bacterium]